MLWNVCDEHIKGTEKSCETPVHSKLVFPEVI